MPTSTSQKLFRAEVLGDDHLWGRVVLLRPLASWTVVCGALALLGALLVFLLYADYSRRVRVAGYLVPEQGLVTVHAPRLGTVERLFIAHGDSVQRGQTLFSVRTSVSTERDGDLGAHIRAELLRQLELLYSRMREHRVVGETSKQQYRMRMDDLRANRHGLERELRLQQRRVQLSGEHERASQRAYSHRAISKMEYNAVHGQLIEQQQREQALRRQHLASSQERVLLPVQRRQRLSEHRQALDALLGQASALRQRLAEAGVNQNYLVSAPLHGRVVSVRLAAGEQVRSDHPAVAIVPSGSRLQARLFIPSRAIGFVKPGMAVRLRYRAFPHERYGTGTGEVEHVGRALMTPTELKVPVTLLEPSFVVSVGLHEQQLAGHGEPLLLQPGLVLDADINVDKRAVWEWMLEPLLRLKGRM